MAQQLQPTAQQPPMRHVLVTPASQVRTVHQVFVKQDWYPADVLTLIAGRAGEGKSTLALADAAAATLGTLPGDYEGHQLVVAITALEDAKPLQRLRLEAAGADLDRVRFVDVANMVAGDALEDVPRIPDDLPAIRAALIEHGASIWIIDPITALVGGDTNRRDDVRAALDPLHGLARELHIAIVGILHFAKGAGHASEKISGSHAFRDVARSVLLVAADDETDDRIVTLDKSNYSQAAGTSWKFQLADTLITTSDGTSEHVAHVVELGESDISVGEIINRDTTSEDDDRNAAQAFIIDYLQGQDSYEAKAGEILKAGHAAGFTDTELKHARSRSKSPRIVSRKGGFGAGWVWALERDALEGATKVPKVPGPKKVAPLAPSHTTVAPSAETDARVRLVRDGDKLRLCPIHHTPLEGLACPTCLAELAQEANHHA